MKYSEKVYYNILFLLFLGAKLSLGQYTSGSSAISPMPNSRFNHGLEKAARPSLVDQGNRGRASHVEAVNLKGYITPMTGRSKHVIPSSDGRAVRASSAERASALVLKGPKKDNRPLTDKAYQNEMLSKIDRYFACIQQTTLLNSNGSVKPLSLKIFIDATNILMQLLDMKPTLNKDNYLQEIPKIAKKLHYPGQVKDSWLKSANTIHGYHHAIGWLSWLVELCEVKDLASEIFTLERLPMFGESDEEKDRERKKFLVMIQCYKAWNEEKPDDEDRIFQQFIQDEAERRGIDDKKYKEIQLEFEKIQENLQKEEAISNSINSKVNELEETLNNMRKDRIKQQEHIIDQENYIEKMIKEIEQFKKDSEIFSKDIGNLEQSKEELIMTIKKQPMTISQRDEIVKACTEQQSYIQNFETHLEEIKKEAYSLDMRLVSTNSSLVKAILAYNQSLFMQFSDSSVNIDELMMPENGICEADFMERLEKKKALMNIFIQERSKELKKKETLLESHNKEIEAMQTKRDTLSEKVQKKKASEEKHKQDLKTKENKKREEIKKLHSSINELNELNIKTSTELEVLNQQLADAIDKREAVVRKNSYMQESAKMFFTQFHNILDDHREKIKNSLEIYLNHQLQEVENS